jgi:hypothetical protein
MQPQNPQYGQPQYGQPQYGQPQQGHGAAHAPPPAISPRVQEALGQLDLLAGEQVIYTMTADGFFLGAHPIAKLVAAIQAAIVALTGGYIRIFLVVTNQRVLVIKNMQMWCGCNRLRSVHAIALAGVKEVGSTRVTHMCCVNTRTVQLQSMTQTFNLVVKRLPDQEIRNFVTNVSAVVVAHTGRASV